MKRKSFLLKIAMFALAIAPVITNPPSIFWVGEPKLPQKMKNKQ